jgi:hypothetical protein
MSRLSGTSQGETRAGNAGNPTRHAKGISAGKPHTHNRACNRNCTELELGHSIHVVAGPGAAALDTNHAAGAGAGAAVFTSDMCGHANHLRSSPEATAVANAGAAAGTGAAGAPAGKPQARDASVPSEKSTRHTRGASTPTGIPPSPQCIEPEHSIWAAAAAAADANAGTAGAAGAPAGKPQARDTSVPSEKRGTSTPTEIPPSPHCIEPEQSIWAAAAAAAAADANAGTAGAAGAPAGKPQARDASMPSEKSTRHTRGASTPIGTTPIRIPPSPHCIEPEHSIWAAAAAAAAADANAGTAGAAGGAGACAIPDMCGHRHAMHRRC